LSFLTRLFGDRRERHVLQPLYSAIVAAGRDPVWYREGGVPDTLEGRFDMIAAVLALVLLRLEEEGEAGKRDSVLLAEIFIDDMDGTLRQIGIGDFVVGKHVGKLMGALGGRLGAMRNAFATGEGLEAVVRGNIFRGAEASDEEVAFVSNGLRALHGRLKGASLEQLRGGGLGGA
jgi:cytochrome b pre-mRNA-processing protein 3